MRILQLSPHDSKGGASRIAWYLHQGYKKRGAESYLAVGKKSLADPTIYQIDHDQGWMPPVFRKIRKWTDILIGLENFNYPATPAIPNLPPAMPDIIHAHNLHGKYFDLRELPMISGQYPTLLTLHDTWLLSGHCAYFIECERWRTGCGHCPDLERGPSVRRDATAFNWKRKQGICERIRVHLATPSQWLLDQVGDTMLMQGVVDAKVIHNGVDLSVFKPANKSQLRKELKIPEDVFVLLFVTASRRGRQSYKDFNTIQNTLESLRTQLQVDRKVIFLGLGQSAEFQRDGNFEQRFIPYQADIHEVARYYQTADLFIHAARADTFPNVILESLACGTPVIATEVGGIPEQITDGKTGYLVPTRDHNSMAKVILNLMDHPERLKKMSAEAAAEAQRRFSLNRMIDDYLHFYEEVISNFSGFQASTF